MTDSGHANVDVLREARAAGLIASAVVILTLVLIACGLKRVAALVCVFGCFAILERLHRLFSLLRSQGRPFACAIVVCTGVCAWAAASGTVYLCFTHNGHFGLH